MHEYLTSKNVIKLTKQNAVNVNAIYVFIRKKKAIEMVEDD